MPAQLGGAERVGIEELGRPAERGHVQTGEHGLGLPGSCRTTDDGRAPARRVAPGRHPGSAAVGRLDRRRRGHSPLADDPGSGLRWKLRAAGAMHLIEQRPPACPPATSGGVQRGQSGNRARLRRTTTRVRDPEQPRGSREGGPQPGPGAARRGRDRQDGTARASSSTGPRDAGWAGRRASSRRWSWRSPACTSCAAPSSTGWTTLPAPQQEALGTAFGLRPGSAPGPLPRGPGGADPALRGGRGAPADLRRGRRPVAGPGVGCRRWSSSRAGSRPSPWPWSSPSASPTRSPGSPGSRSSSCAGWAAAMRRRCCESAVAGHARPPGPGPHPGREPRQPAGPPRAAARAVRGRAGLRRRCGCRGAAPLVHRLEQGFLRQVTPLPRQSRRLLLTAAADPVGDVPLLWRAAERLGIGADAAAAAEASGLIELRDRVRFRHPLVRSAVYRSADPGGAAGRPPGARRRHRPGGRSRPPGLAPLQRGPGPGRGRRRGARAVRRPRARARRPGGGGRVPRTGRGAHARSGAAGAALAGRRPGQGARRRLRRRLGPGGDGRGGTARGGRAGPDRPAAAEMSFAANRGNEALPLLLAAARRLEPLDARLARDTYLDALSAALFAGRLADRSRRTPGRRGGAERPAAGRAAQGRHAARGARRAVHRRVRAGGATRAPRGAGVRRRGADDGRGAALGLARGGHGGRPCGTTSAGTPSPVGTWRSPARRERSARCPWR